MGLNSQAALFELLTGLFGWIWIAAGIATAGFAVYALFFEGSWWNVLWSVLSGAVAKWLAGGFMANQLRVQQEMERDNAGP